MRRRLTWVPVALLVTAVIEITAFVLLAQVIGFGWAFLLVLITSMAGVLLLRREGMRAWRRFRDAAQSGRPPGDQVTDGVVGLAAGVLLAVPGLVTALLAILLAVPPGRILARRGARRFAEGRMSSAVAGDLFGPRRVRVRRGAPRTESTPSRPVTAQPVGAEPGPTAGQPSAPVNAGPVVHATTAGRGLVDGDVIEGEIVEPRDR
jgi:UPF0716 protein FxsA